MAPPPAPSDEPATALLLVRALKALADNDIDRAEALLENLLA